MDATALATCPSTNIGFVDFDMLPDLPTQSILIRANHASAELVENLERCLVASQPKLPLKLHSRHAGRLTGHQVGSPKPYAQRRMRKFHHRSSRQSGIALALAATKGTGAIGKPIWFTIHSAVRADKSVAPSSFLQVSRAGRIVGKEPLEPRQRLRKRQAVALINIHEHIPIIIPLAILGNNRIGVVGTIGKMSWIAMLFVLLAVEYRAIDKEQADTAKSFSQILQGLTTTNDGLKETSTAISTTADLMTAQFKEQERLSRGIQDNMTGGDSFCYLVLQPSQTAGRLDMFVIQQGKNSVSNTSVQITDLEKPLTDLSAIINFTIPLVYRGTSSTTLSALPWDSGDYKKFNIFMTAPNGRFVEIFRLKKVGTNNMWGRAILVSGSYYDGRSGIVFEDVREFPHEILESDSDWKSNAKLKRLNIEK